MKVLKVPQYEQTFEYDCGAKAVESILSYYGIYMKEEKIMKALKTNKNGTPASTIISFLKRKGLMCMSKENLTIDDLKKYIDYGSPVLILVQAWKKNKGIEYKKTWNSGHWVIAIGYNKRKIIFEDPYITQRSYLNFSELEDRWHDKLQDLGKVRKYGIIVKGKSKYKNLGKIIHMD